MPIQWFPGHMAKARREVTEKLPLIDIVYEIVDARIPLSSSNPMLGEILRQKPRIVLLNKADLADSQKTDRWIHYFESLEIPAIPINSQTGEGLSRIPQATQEKLKEKMERMRKKGIRPRPIRAMVLGIPNSGKSTLINRLAKRSAAKTGNIPGITKAPQWIKVGKEIELLDTPGILWPKFEDETVGMRLALTGAIKDTLLNLQDVAVFALQFLKREYPERLKERYQLEEIPEEMADLFDWIGKKRGAIGHGGTVDYDRTASLIIQDFRSGKLGRITLERPAGP